MLDQPFVAPAGDAGGRGDVRASDAQRQQAIDALRSCVTDGRLTLDEFAERAAEVYGARSVGDLGRALRQLGVGFEAGATGDGRDAGDRRSGWLRRRRPVMEPRVARPTRERRAAPPPPPATAGRTVATVLYADVVESTQRLAALGDAAWRDLLDDHEAIVTAELACWQGAKLFTKGDEFVALFQRPAYALHCAASVRAMAARLGLQIRCGVHAGEVERRGADATGIAMHIGARIASVAEPGEVLASSTVRDLVAGSEIPFEARGEFQLKGVPGVWRLFSALPGPAAPGADRAHPGA